MNERMKHISDAVEKHSKLILEAERHIWKNPETGYKEEKTSKYLEGKFKEMGYNTTPAGDIPGFCAELDTGRKGPCVLVLGEMDSLICAEHPECDPVTKAAHVCGHNAQTAALLGVAAALADSDIAENWSGKVRFCAVPAEELIEIGFRDTLKEKGIIKYYGGKTEFLYRGYFDGADMAMMVHARACEGFYFNAGSVGCLAKKIVYKGKSAHAGGAPHEGINALYAANLGLSAVNALRETFRECDTIRFHPIITKGGSAVNAIPDEVIVESYVRGMTLDAIERENNKINRALTAAAAAMGANVEIFDNPGYSPYVTDKNFAEAALKSVSGTPYEYKFNFGETETSSTDMGDLSSVMPTIQPYAGGAAGTQHGKDFYIKDPQTACVDNAKVQIRILDELLCGGAETAIKIAAEAKPLFASKEDYFKKIDSLVQSGDRIKYEDGRIILRC